MRTIHLETILPTSADRVWRAMQSPVTFLYVCKGLFGVPALSGRAEPLVAGERGTGWLFAFHLVPAYRHTIEVSEVDEPTLTIRTHESAACCAHGITRCGSSRSTRKPVATPTPSLSMPAASPRSLPRLRSVSTVTGNGVGANSFACICYRRVRPTRAECATRDSLVRMRTRRGASVFMATILAAMAVVPNAAAAPRNFDLVAHQGGPANTSTGESLPAFANALETGVSTLELDIGITKDRQPVVWHDEVNRAVEMC